MWTPKDPCYHHACYEEKTGCALPSAQHQSLQVVSCFHKECCRLTVTSSEMIYAKKKESKLTNFFERKNRYHNYFVSYVQTNTEHLKMLSDPMSQPGMDD